MTEFEFHTLLVEYFSLAHFLVTNLVTVLSGFLIASYIVAHKLSTTMARVVVGLFTGAMLTITAQLGFVWMDAAAIAGEIQSFPAKWHFVSRTGDTALILSGIVFISASLIGYIAALAFFFHQRRQRKQQ